MMHVTFTVITLFCGVMARPYNIQNIDSSSLTPQTSPLIKTVDSMTTSFATALRTASPNVVPVISVGTLAYLGYVASVMFIPSTLKENGIPILDDFSFETRAMRSESGFVDGMITGFVKDLISRTEVADVLKNTSIAALQQSMMTFGRTIKMLNIGISSFQGIVKRLTEALSTNCLSKFMCRVGEFTQYNFPFIRPILTNLRTLKLDNFSQAFIDGASIGDCNTIFSTCQL